MENTIKEVDRYEVDRNYRLKCYDLEFQMREEDSHKLRRLESPLLVNEYNEYKHYAGDERIQGRDDEATTSLFH